jgi:hypothetical protein
MVFKNKKFQKFQYKRSSYKDGLIGELTLKESGNKNVDSFTFKNSNELKTVLGVLKKYGFNTEELKDVDDELKNLQEHRNWLDKKEGDMEW